MNLIKNDKNAIEELSTGFIGKQIDLHIAEYNALTTRVTYFINIQNLLLTAFIAWIIVIGTVWNPNYKCLLFWGLLLGSQVIAIINATIAYENYNIIRYIESELKPKICELIKNKLFWGYESYLLKQRVKNHENGWLIIFDFIFVFLMASGLIIITILRLYDWYCWDWFGLFINLLLLAPIVLKTIQTSKLRVKAWKL